MMANIVVVILIIQRRIDSFSPFFEGSKRNITRFYTYRGIDKRKGNLRIPRYITEIFEEGFRNIRFLIFQNITMYL